jgi:hypothetical protein
VVLDTNDTANVDVFAAARGVVFNYNTGAVTDELSFLM